MTTKCKTDNVPLIIPTKFVESASPTPPITFNTEKEIKEWLTERYSGGYHFGIDQLRHGFYRQSGWFYDFRKYLRCYLVKEKDNNAAWHEYWGPSAAKVKRAFHLNRWTRVISFPKKVT